MQVSVWCDICDARDPPRGLWLAQVRSAGEDAWLCKPAPADPLIDDTAGEDGEEMVSARSCALARAG